MMRVGSNGYVGIKNAMPRVRFDVDTGVFFNSSANVISDTVYPTGAGRRVMFAWDKAAFVGGELTAASGWQTPSSE